MIWVLSCQPSRPPRPRATRAMRMPRRALLPLQPHLPRPHAPPTPRINPVPPPCKLRWARLCASPLPPHPKSHACLTVCVGVASGPPFLCCRCGRCARCAFPFRVLVLDSASHASRLCGLRSRTRTHSHTRTRIRAQRHSWPFRQCCYPTPPSI